MSSLLLRYLPILFAIDAALVVIHLVWGGDPYWNLDKEHNFPTWFSGLQLSLIALATLECHRRERDHEIRLVPGSGAWALLAVTFFYLSVDETTVIHEGVLRNELRDLLPPDSLWISLLPWQILFGPLLGLIALLLLAMFVTRFSREPDLYAPAVSGLVCWGGAVLAEGLAKPWFMVRGWYHYEAAIEEGLELFGATLLVTAMARYSGILERRPPVVLEPGARARRLALATVGLAVFVAFGASLVAAVSLQNSAWLYRHNAAQLQKRGKLREAVVAWEKSLEREPDNQSAWSGLARTQYRLRDYPASLQSYERTIELHPKSARLWRSRGAILHRLERYSEAEESYRKAIDLGDSSAKTYAYLGQTLERLDRITPAVEAYERSLEIDPDQPATRRRLERLRRRSRGPAPTRRRGTS